MDNCSLSEVPTSSIISHLVGTFFIQVNETTPLIINKPVVEHFEAYTQISSVIEFERAPSHKPWTCWFRVPNAYGKYLNDRADAFAASLLLHAMAHRERLTIRSSISPRLLLGLRDYGDVFHLWYPVHFRLVSIEAESTQVNLSTPRGTAVGSMFSGGVDSFYTLHRSLSERTPPSMRISHCFFVQGMDIRVENTEKFDFLKEEYRKLLTPLGVELIPVSTNIRQIPHAVNWDYTHGASIQSIGLLFENLLGTMYIPSNDTVDTRIPYYGANPVLHPLLSTEKIEFINESLTIRRQTKIETLAQWPVAWDHLRVCFGKTNKSHHNCGICKKCSQLKLSLELASAWGKFRKCLPGRITFGDLYRASRKGPMNQYREFGEVLLAFKRKKFLLAFQFLVICLMGLWNPERSQWYRIYMGLKRRFG